MDETKSMVICLLMAFVVPAILLGSIITIEQLSQQDPNEPNLALQHQQIEALQSELSHIKLSVSKTLEELANSPVSDTGISKSPEIAEISRELSELRQYGSYSENLIKIRQQLANVSTEIAEQQAILNRLHESSEVKFSDLTKEVIEQQVALTVLGDSDTVKANKLSSLQSDLEAVSSKLDHTATSSVDLTSANSEQLETLQREVQRANDERLALSRAQNKFLARLQRLENRQTANRWNSRGSSFY